MLDLTSIIMLAGLFVGLVVGDAVLFGDPVQVQISVPSKVSDAGFTEAAAEQVFAAQVGELGEALSIVHTPNVQVSTRPTILAALAKPLSLDNVVVAIQSQAGVDVVTVHSVILAQPTGNQLDMVSVISIPHEVPVQIKLAQENGDATALVQRSAESAMEYVSPYRLALTHFVRGLHGDTAELTQAKDIATRAVARPWVPARASEQVMLHNLLAMLALLDGDDATVHAQFRLTDPIPDASPAAHGVIELNRSFLDVAAGRTVEAERHYQLAKTLTAQVTLAGWSARVTTLGALVAWSRGDLAQAEAILRRAIVELPDDAAAHTYLAQLLEMKGDTIGAASQRTAAGNSSRFEKEFPSEAQTLFWVDPVHGGLRRRS